MGKGQERGITTVCTRLRATISAHIFPSPLQTSEVDATKAGLCCSPQSSATCNSFVIQTWWSKANTRHLDSWLTMG